MMIRIVRYTVPGIYSNNAIIKNVYDTSDMLQRIGGFDDFSKTFASQKIDDNNVKNIKVESPNYGTIIYPTNILNIKEQLLEDHSNLDTKDVWEQFNEK